MIDLSVLQPVLRPPRAADDLALGMRLSKMQGRHVGPVQVARALRRAGIRYAIVGTHAVNAYSGRPRSTADVDVIVQNATRATVAIAKRFGQLARVRLVGMTRFRDDRLEAIDLLHAAHNPLWRRLLDESRELVVAKQRLTIVSLEGILAAKFQAMRMPQRRYDRMLDAADFVRIVQANKNINSRLLAELGDLACCDGCSILQCLADAQADRRLPF